MQRLSLLLFLAFAALWPSSAAAQLDDTNNASLCTASTGYDDTATSIVVSSGCGATLPTPPFNMSWCNVTDYPGGCFSSSYVRDPNYEIVRVTGIATDTLTVTRNAEGGFGASTKNTGGKTYVLSTFTAKTITDINTALGATFLTTSTNSVLTNEAVLTGTANQVILTGSTLSTPQDIHSAATPTFGGLTLSGLTADRVPIISTGGLLSSTANLQFRDAANDVYRLRVLNTTTAQGGLTNEAHTVRAIMKGNGASRIAGVKRGVYVQMDDDSVVNKTITGAANNGSGLIRITATAHGFTTGDGIGITGVTGTTEANSVWLVTVIDANNFDLQGSTFTNAYVSGGTATTRSSMAGVHVLLQPTLDRTSAGTGTAFNDDLNAYTAQASGNGKSTDAYYLAGNPSISGAPAWVNAFATDADSNYFFRATGKAYSAGIDLESATVDTAIPMITLGAGHDIKLDTATGTKIGTSTSQKLGFFNSTPVVQPASTTDLRTALINLGLYATGGASPLDLNGGAFSAATVSLGGTSIGTSISSLIDQDASNPTQIFEKYTATGGGPTFTTYKGRGSKGSETRTKSGDTLLTFNSRGFYGASDGAAGTATGNVAVIRLNAWEDFTSTAQGTYAAFYTTPLGSTTSAVRAVVTSRGVEVGAASSLAARSTTDPTNALNIYDGTPPDGTLTNGGSLYSTSGELLAMDSGGNPSNLTAPFTSSVQGIVPASGGSSTQQFLTQAATFASPVYNKSITVESPGASEDLSMWFADDAITVTKMVAVLVGSSTPSVTWTVRHSTDRSATGNEVVTSGTTTTSTTTGSVVTAFNDATVPADSFVWMETTAQSGTVGQINITVYFTID